MKVTAETELMKNQKHAEVLSPEKSFQVAQTPAGDALFFSIGTDNRFYITRQLRGSQTGWQRIDLSTPLSARHGGSTVQAKTFALSQHSKTLNVDLVLAITLDGQDYLYSSFGNVSEPEHWQHGITWADLQFDAAGTTKPSPLTISDVLLMSFPSPKNAEVITQSCFVDIIRSRTDPFQILDRYFIDPSATSRWTRHSLPIDLKAGSISSCLGHRSNDFLPGIYTLGQIGATEELIYAEQYNFFDPTIGPSPARLTLPAGASSMTSVLNGSGDSNLFVAGTAGLYLYKPDNQNDAAEPVLVVPTRSFGRINMFTSVRSLAAFTSGSRTVVCGLNANGDLFHVYCKQGAEDDANAWSTPLPLLSGVQQFSFYLNNANATSNNIFFAHTKGENIVRLVQNSVDGTWSQNSVLLPPTKNDDVVSFNSYTTHIQVSNEMNVGISDAKALFTSTSPVGVYINNDYHLLTPDAPVEATTTPTGSFTVVQEAQGFASATTYAVEIEGPPSIKLNVDPLDRVMQRLGAVQSTDDLDRQVTMDDGSKKPLVDPSVSTDDKKAAASSIKQLMKIKSSLPADPATKQASLKSAAHNAASDAHGVALDASSSFGVFRQKGQMQFGSASAAMQALGISEHKTTNGGPLFMQRNLGGSVGDWITTAAGDLLNGLKGLWDDVEGFIVQQADGIWNVVVKLAGQVYHAVLNTVAVVVHFVEFVVNTIKIFIEEIIAWLGFLFNWHDIMRTKRVIKNVVRQYVRMAIGQLDTLEDKVNDVFGSMESKLNSWASIADTGAAAQSLGQGDLPGHNDPQTNWALSHTQNGLDSASSDATEGSDRVADDAQKLLDDLSSIFTGAIDNPEDMFVQIKEEVIDNILSQSPITTLKKILAITGNFILKDVQGIIVKGIDLFKLIADGIMALLDFSIDIPVISWLYKLITGDNLTMLDLACLVGAIPATLIYKLIMNENPFPDDDFTNALIDAPDASTITRILSSGKAHPTLKADNASASKSVAGPVLRAVEIDSDKVARATSALYFAAAGATLLVIITNFAKDAGDGSSPPTLWLGALNYCSVLVYASPNIIGGFSNVSRWTTIMNDIIMIFWATKAGIDNINHDKVWQQKISPVLEFLYNLVWFVPAAGFYIEGDCDEYCLVANCMFDFSGVLAIAQLFRNSKNPEAKVASAIAFVTAQELNKVYAVFCGLEGKALANKL
jgi:hypothetical protein